MIINIGLKAGEIYKHLEKNGAQTLYALKKEFENTKDIIPMAIGWLAREDKITFVESDKTIKISIKEM
jgi:hypothetical protein